MRRLVSGILLTMLLFSTLTLAFNIQPVKASGTVYIRADGSVDPPTTPMQRDGDYYILTDNITASAEGIVIERDNIVLDGTDHTVQGPAPYVAYCKGIDLSGRKNVTIKNIGIRAFDFGIYLNYSSDINIHRNNMRANNLIGLVLQSSSNNGITANDITYNYYGIQLRGSNNNCISGNQIVSNGPGIGIALVSSSNNTLYRNNFINNAFDVSSEDSINVLDDGYPSGGNYWSDYTGVDLLSGPYQNVTGSDGLGDTPYIIDAENQDRYPLMHLWSSLPVHNMNTGSGYATIQEAINNAADGDTILVSEGTYVENVIVYKSLNILGEGRFTTSVSARDTNGDVFRVTADFTNISGFAIQGATISTGSGIHLQANNCTISGNTVTNNFYGVYLEFSQASKVVENSIDSSFIGMYLVSSSDNEISNNLVESNDPLGIALWSNSNNNSIIENRVNSNGAYGLSLQGGSNTNIIKNNDLGLNSIGIYISESHNNIIADNNASGNTYCGIALDYSDNNRVVANNVSSNSVLGIVLAGSNNNTVEENIASQNNIDLWNSYGISIFLGSSSNAIRHNNISTNMNGILLLSSSGNIILENDLVSNLNYAIRTEGANGNSIYHNNFIDNMGQLYNWEQQSMNVWDDGFPSGGNYWSDYSELDEDGDGIGDLPYIIDSRNQDNYPLAKAWTPPDIAVANVSVSKTVIGQGYALHVDAVCVNQGEKIESVEAVLYANTSVVATQKTILKSGFSKTVTLMWKTAGAEEANYTIIVCGTELAGEIDTNDNTLVYGTIKVSCIGDVNGDFITDSKDLLLVRKGIPSMPNEPSWDSQKDVDGDGVTDGRDYVIVRKHIPSYVP